MYFDIVADDDLNAYANTINDTHVVGVNRGSAINIYTFFSLLLSHPEVLPDIGDASKESIRFESLEDTEWSDPTSKIKRQVHFGGHPKGLLPMPCDDTRLQLARTLASMATDFLYHHEVCHIRRGHVRCMHTDFDRPRFAEFDPGLNKLKVKQALEIDADNGAIGIMLTPPLLGKTIRGYQMTKADIAEFTELWFVAVTFLFYLFDSRANPIEAYTNESHPHPLVRLFNVMHHGETIAREQGVDPENIKNKWLNAMERLSAYSQQKITHPERENLMRAEYTLLALGACPRIENLLGNYS